MRKTFPSLQLDDSIEAQIVREITNAPRHDSDFGRRQLPEGRAMKMIEVSMCQKDEIDRRQIADPATGALDPLEEKKPVREIWIDQDIQVAELNEERGVANPGQGDVTFGQLGKNRAAVLAGSAREPS